MKNDGDMLIKLSAFNQCISG